MYFSTIDSDNDNNRGDCASVYRSGWWHNSCVHSNLNGEYRTDTKKDGKELSWYHWGNTWAALKSAVMMVRPIQNVWNFEVMEEKEIKLFTHFSLCCIFEVIFVLLLNGWNIANTTVNTNQSIGYGDRPEESHWIWLCCFVLRRGGGYNGVLPSNSFFGRNVWFRTSWWLINWSDNVLSRIEIFQPYDSGPLDECTIYMDVAPRANASGWRICNWRIYTVSLIW